MRSINLPTDLLRTFVSVIDLGGYTRAADALGRTQPAVSLQMKRLEELLDARLITHEGRELKLTEEGEALAVYARQLLRLNDEGLSLQAGRLPGYPAADTAVRLPALEAPLVFQRVKKGTRVTIEE